MPRPVLVLDLDGTVCIGEAPVRDYARAVEDLAPRSSGLLDALDEFLRDPDASEDLRSAQDGYQAVQLLCEQVGIDAETRNRAYAQSRAALRDAGGDLRAPEGLADLLAALDVHTILITNAPGEGIDGLLRHLGVDKVVEEVRTDAGKPSRMRRLLADLLDRHGVGGCPAHLLSLGDIWLNDLAPALELGCATAYVDTYGRAQGPAHVRARTLPELYPALRAWAAEPAEFVRTHPLPPATVSAGSTPDRPGRDT